MDYKEIREIDVSEKVEKKGDFSYLSWAWAWDFVLSHDADAKYEYPEPTTFPDGTMMVYCDVTFKGKTRRSHLPVLDFKNQVIKNPNAFQINTAMQRCFVKAIAMHGLGLYIYAGEDLPGDKKQAQAESSKVSDICTMIDQCRDEGAFIQLQDDLKDEIEALSEISQKTIEQKIEFRAEQIKNGIHPTVKHTFAGVKDAEDWCKKMKPVVDGFKSSKVLSDWEQNNLPYIEGLDILKAEKYKKDGKLPKERFNDALQAKYDELKTIEDMNQPLAAE